MSLLPPLKQIPLSLKPMTWSHKRHYGEVLSPIKWWGRIPFVFYLVSMFVGYLERRSSPLNQELRALVSARVAQLCHCEFCVDITHMKIMKTSEKGMDKLLALPEWQHSPLFNEQEKIALAYAEAATMTPPMLTDELRQQLNLMFSEKALTELTALIGLQNLSARFNSVMDIPMQGLCQLPQKQ